MVATPADLLSAALYRLPIFQDGERTAYRARVVYGDLSSSAVAADGLGVPCVQSAATSLASWIETHSRMPPDFFRDATIRASRSGGRLLEKR